MQSMRACLFWAGAHVDNTQMLPSPFDNVHGGANAVSHVPSSMQQSSAEGDNKAAGNQPCDVTRMHTACRLHAHVLNQHTSPGQAATLIGHHRGVRNEVCSCRRLQALRLPNSTMPP